MGLPTASARLTFEEYRSLPLPDDVIYELVDVPAALLLRPRRA